MNNSLNDLFYILKNKDEEPELKKSDAYMFRYLMKCSCFVAGACLAYITINCNIEQSLFSIFGYIFLSLLYGFLVQIFIFIFSFLQKSNLGKIYFLLPALVVLAYSFLNGK